MRNELARKNHHSKSNKTGLKVNQKKFTFTFVFTGRLKKVKKQHEKSWLEADTNRRLFFFFRLSRVPLEHYGSEQLDVPALIIHCLWVSERSKQCKASKWVRDVNEPVNGRVSGPSWFLFVLYHCALVGFICHQFWIKIRPLLMGFFYISWTMSEVMTRLMNRTNKLSFLTIAEE